jgi:hypothetical protein
MKTFDSVREDGITFVFDECRTKFDFIAKCELLDSIEIAILETSEKPEPSTGSAF